MADNRFPRGNISAAGECRSQHREWKYSLKSRSVELHRSAVEGSLANYYPGSVGGDDAINNPTLFFSNATILASASFGATTEGTDLPRSNQTSLSVTAGVISTACFARACAALDDL